MRVIPRAYVRSSMPDCSTRSKVIRPIKKSEGSSTRLNTKKAVPMRETCPVKAMAIKAPETAPIKRVQRPLASATVIDRSEEHTSELQSHSDLVCRLLLEKKKNDKHKQHTQ